MRVLLQSPPTRVPHIYLDTFVNLFVLYLFTYLILSLQAFEYVTKVKDFTAYVLVIEHVSHQEDVCGAEHFAANVGVAVQEVGLQHLDSLQALLTHLSIDVKSKPTVRVNVICNNATSTTPIKKLLNTQCIACIAQ